MTGVGVVIPANDEEALIERCLRAVTVAAETLRVAHPAVRVEVVLVLDACTDRSDEIAAGWPVTRVRLDARRVGAARREGVHRALALLGDVPPSEIWLAHTDADSAVPAHWLLTHLAAMRAGADLLLGTVRPDPADLTARHTAHWAATHPRGRPAGNVHGANLGVRGSVYLDAGGFAAVAEHEDVGLVERAVALGAEVRVSDEAEVLTSGRFVGRTPGGYAAFVRATHDALARRSAPGIA